MYVPTPLELCKMFKSFMSFYMKYLGFDSLNPNLKTPLRYLKSFSSYVVRYIKRGTKGGPLLNVKIKNIKNVACIL